MNRTLIELLALNVANLTENWDVNLGIILIEYRSAIQSSTGYTSHFMLFGRDMRLPLEVMYRTPEASFTRFDYPNEVCKTLADAYERAIERLHLALKKQNDYYDRRMSGIRVAPGDSVLL